jgi:Holliday junction resolvase RusA-like endonuclease
MKGSKMTEKLIIPGELTGLNEIIAISKEHWAKYAEEKHSRTEEIAFLAKNQIKGKYQMVDLVFTWFCKNRKRDKDNIIAGQKFVIDGLVAAGVIENDGWKQIRNIFHYFEIDNKNPRVEIIIKEAEE